jgi:tetratricopeptide (TPR) repeat protein
MRLSPPQASSRDELARTVEAERQMAEEHYQKAIVALEQIAHAEDKTLDPQVAATLRKNLGVIDQAISESRAALKSQPDSEPAQASLFEAFRDKLTLLQDTVALINEMRKGIRLRPRGSRVE